LLLLTAVTFGALIAIPGEPSAWASGAWSAPSQIDGPGNLFKSVSCASSTFCVAVDDEGDEMTFNGNSWSLPQKIFSGELFQISCPTNGFCVLAVLGGGYCNDLTGVLGSCTLVLNDGTWSAVPVLQANGTPDAYAFAAISCATATFCMAADEMGGVYTFNGRSWSEGVQPPVGLSSEYGPGQWISCVSASFCAASSGNSVLTFDGSSWSAPQDLNFNVSSVSCVSPTDCVAVGPDHYYSLYNGELWSPFATVANGGLSEVSCPNAGFCMAIGDFTPGDALSFNGTSWSVPQQIDSTKPLIAVSCPSENFCAAVDYRADVLIYSVAPSLPIQRIYGQDAIGTSIAVSQASFPTSGSAKAVVLARSDFFSDALAGGPLAVQVGGPLLITPGASISSSLDSRVQAEIQRVLPTGDTVYILGGQLALSPSIDTTLQGLGYNTQRVAGSDEYATAVDIAEQLGNPSTVFETTGLSFYDALSAVPAVIDVHGAILLTEGTTQAPETATYLAANPSDTRYAIGGPLAAAGADPSAMAIYGQDLYGTAAAVASTFFPSPSTFGAATSASFSDALSGGPTLGLADAPMLLVPPSGPLPSSIENYLSGVASSLTSGTVFGGPLAVGDDVLAELEAAS
jgi:hypothetical protein